MEADSLSALSLTPSSRSPMSLTRRIPPPVQVQSTPTSLTDASPPHIRWFSKSSPLSRPTWKRAQITNHIPSPDRTVTPSRTPWKRVQIPIHIPSPDRTASQQQEYEAEKKAWLQEYRAANNLEDPFKSPEPSQSSRLGEYAARQYARLESIAIKVSKFRTFGPVYCSFILITASITF